METYKTSAKHQQRSVSKELTLEMQLTEAKRQLAAREKTIESQARELERVTSVPCASHVEDKERWHKKAWEIEKLVISLGNSLNGGN
jgi:hypothetical protein